MSSKKVLKSSFIGYIYRGMRVLGIVLTIAGTWLLGDIVFHGLIGGKAIATITRLQSVCVLQGTGAMAQAVRTEVECSEADKTMAQYPSVPFAIGEISYGYFAFKTEDGEAQEVRAPLASLEALGAEHGSAVSIVYKHSNPAMIRPAMPMGALLRALSFLTGGIAILFAVLTIRWIANQRGGIELDVQRLHEVHTTNVRSKLRLPIDAVVKNTPAVRMTQRRR